MQPSIKPHQPLHTNPIPLPHQPRNIHIQRTRRLRARFPVQHVLHSFQCFHNSIRGRSPIVREEVETNFSCGEFDVGVADGGREVDGGWVRGIGGGEVDVEVPFSACLVFC